MSLRSLLSDLRVKWEGWFDRAIRSGGNDSGRRAMARDEFINTLIIDHGAASRKFEGRAPGNRLRD